MQHATGSGQILLLDEDREALTLASAAIVDQVPHVTVTSVHTSQQYKDELHKANFDLVIVDLNLTNGSALELLHSARLKDYDAAVMALTTADDACVVSKIYNSGCQRLIVKHGEWLNELGPAVRQALRIKKLEEENRLLLARLTEANKLLQDRNRDLDQFSAAVAHDIRGVLANVGMRLEYLSDGSKAQLEPKLFSILDGAAQATRRLTDVVQATYDFAKLGAQARDMQRVDLDKLLQEVLADLSIGESKNVMVELGALPAVWGNADLLRRLFLNLISNSIRYGDKAEVKISIGCEGIESRSVADYAKIAIADNGPGIPEDKKQQIFGMYWQAISAPKSEEGLGMGLAMVQRIVELHRGTISLESQPGRGTKFVLTLPQGDVGFLR